MKIAFMFPGQGSQYSGMGKSLYNDSSGVKKMFDEADDLLGVSLSEIIFSGSSVFLGWTENTQPAILLVSAALWEYLKPRLKTSQYSVIGHSLGEYSAYMASGRLSFSDAISLVRKRGLLMTSPKNLASELGMMAALKISMEDLSEIVKIHGMNELFIANDNCPGQIVISGLKTSMTHISQFVANKGGKLISLDVSGAFHSPYMEPVAEKLEQELKSISFLPSTIPLYSNLTASPLKVGDEKTSLVQQMYKPVRFRESIQNMIENEGITHFIEVGPGKVLQGLVRKINPDVKVFGVEDIEGIEAVLQEGI